MSIPPSDYDYDDLQSEAIESNAPATFDESDQIGQKMKPTIETKKDIKARRTTTKARKKITI